MWSPFASDRVNRHLPGGAVAVVYAALGWAASAGRDRIRRSEATRSIGRIGPEVLSACSLQGRLVANGLMRCTQLASPPVVPVAG